MITLTFPCGAEYSVADVPQFSHVDKRGRGRLLVYDSEGCQPPRRAGTPAPCRLDCPVTKRESGRKAFNAVRSDGRFSPPRRIVTCYAHVAGEELEPLTDITGCDV
jgi:hypothetical protein